MDFRYYALTDLASAQAGEAAQPAGALPALDRKIIYTGHVDLVVEEFEGVPEKVDALVRQHQAYVASSNLQGSKGSPRTGEWTIRVPVERYDSFVAAAKGLGEVRSVRSDSQEVTEEFYDLESRIRNKKQEEERLLKHLDESTGNLEQILVVERELSRVRGEVEQMEGRLRVLADLTTLATVNLNVEEIKDYQPPQAPTYGTRVARAFDDSTGQLVDLGQDLSIAAVYAGPWLGVLLVLGLLAALVVKALLAVRRRSRAARSPFAAGGPT